MLAAAARGRFAGMAGCLRQRAARAFSTSSGGPGTPSSSHLGDAAVIGACYFGACLWLYRDYAEQEREAAVKTEADAPLPKGIEGILTELQSLRGRIDAMDETSKWLNGGCSTGPIVVVGTGGGADSVYTFRVAPDRSQVVPVGGATKVGLNPAWVNISTTGDAVYVAHEGAVSALSVDPRTCELSALGEAQSAAGSGTAFVAPDKSNKHVLAANYKGGSVTVVPVQADGSLGPATDTKQHAGPFKPHLADRQEAAHPHSIRVDPWVGKWALVPDLGKDMCVVYAYDESKGILSGVPDSPSQYRTREGAGPRHLAFSPPSRKEPLVYLLNELDATLSTLAFDTATGTLTERQTVGLLPYYVKPDRRGHCGSAEVAVHPSGKFVYASNRTNHTIAVLSVDPDSGELALQTQVPCGGTTPRHFQISSEGDYLVVANQSSKNIATFRIDQKTGMLAKPALMPMPVSPRGICIIDDKLESMAK